MRKVVVFVDELAVSQSVQEAMSARSDIDLRLVETQATQGQWSHVGSSTSPSTGIYRSTSSVTSIPLLVGIPEPCVSPPINWLLRSP